MTYVAVPFSSTVTECSCPFTVMTTGPVALGPTLTVTVTFSPGLTSDMVMFISETAFSTVSVVVFVTEVKLSFPGVTTSIVWSPAVRLPITNSPLPVVLFTGTTISLPSIMTVTLSIPSGISTEIVVFSPNLAGTGVIVMLTS